jgi:hemoglobin-like flavoprotein
MNEDQKNLVRQTFAQIAPIAPLAANLFYTRLFAIDPSTQALFTHEPGSPGMAQQGTKLMQMLGVAVANLDTFDTITPAISALGQRHTTYGVEPAHYASVGTALLWTLEQGLGDAYTAEVAAAWTALYTQIAGVMQG